MRSKDLDLNTHGGLNNLGETVFAFDKWDLAEVCAVEP